MDTTPASAATTSTPTSDDNHLNMNTATALGDFLQFTVPLKPTTTLNTDDDDDDDDVTASTEGIHSDSLSDAQSMHTSSFARQSLLSRHQTVDNDDDSSSCSSSTCSDDVPIDQSILEESLTLLYAPKQTTIPSSVSSSFKLLDHPLHRTSATGWGRRRSGFDSLSCLKTIESASEEEDFSSQEDGEGTTSQDDNDNDNNNDEPQEDLQALCSSTTKRTKLLGEGAFGQVWLVLHNKSSKAYALKVCAKYDLISEGAVQQVLRERQIWSNLHHPFICSLVASKQDDNFLFMLQEYCAGGELFSLLERQAGGRLRESAGRFYIACIADALRYLHQQRIIYRDLKPENIMIDELGFPQLIDFGCAKQFVPNNENDNDNPADYQTRTLCGTPRFVSPEMIEPDRYGGGHSFATDYWALGVLLYEMLLGSNPYEYDGMMEGQVYESIIDEDFSPSLADEHSEAVKDFLDKLLVHNPAKRLGSKNESQVLMHRWFVDLDMSTLRKRPNGAAPWTPDLSDLSSTQYFDDWDNVLESKFSQSYPCLSCTQKTMFTDF